MEDQFDKLPMVSGAFIKFKNVGDKFKGTLTGMRKNIHGKYGPENLYDFKAVDGSPWVFSTRKQVLVDEMKNLKIGQLVKLELTELRPNTKGQPTHIIKHFADPSIVDEIWLKEQEVLATQEDISHEPESDNETQVDTDSIPFATEQETRQNLVKISELAVKKLGISDPSLIKEAVKEKTKLDFVDMNLPKIIGILEKLPNAV